MQRESQASVIYEGWVEHRRHEPAVHRFRYHIALVYLDLAEIDQILGSLPRWLCSTGGWSLLRFRRADYLGLPGQSLADAVRDLLVSRGLPPPTGPIRLLTQLRQFGYVFNPVSFYYCFDDQEQLQRVIAEVSNTPWGERHWYVLEHENSKIDEKTNFPTVQKEFHVSPFMDLHLQYIWQLSPPGANLLLGIQNQRNSITFFDVVLSMSRRELGWWNLVRMLLRYPFQPQRVVAAIYWQAFWLWWKRVPFVPHPNRAKKNPAKEPLEALKHPSQTDNNVSADPAVIPNSPEEFAS